MTLKMKISTLSNLPESGYYHIAGKLENIINESPSLCILYINDHTTKQYKNILVDKIIVKVWGKHVTKTLNMKVNNYYLIKNIKATKPVIFENNKVRIFGNLSESCNAKILVLDEKSEFYKLIMNNKVEKTNEICKPEKFKNYESKLLSELDNNIENGIFYVQIKIKNIFDLPRYNIKKNKICLCIFNSENVKCNFEFCINKNKNDYKNGVLILNTEENNREFCIFILQKIFEKDFFEDLIKKKNILHCLVNFDLINEKRIFTIVDYQ
ncbi:hypothetical protein GVAV_001725 [Gurleya vavrai]